MSFLWIGLGALAAWLAADALLFTPFEVRHRKLRTQVRRVPEGLRGKRIMQLSDLHVGGWTYREIFIRQHVEASAPDMIVITGDLLSSGRGIPAILELLEGLRAPMGVWFVPGNNEIEEIRLDRFVRQLEGIGIRCLVNQAARVTDDFWIVGVDDPSLDRDDLNLALREVPEGAFRLLLSHSPEMFYQAADRGVELTLAGHTHGGQVRIPLIGPLYADTQRSGLRFVLGEYRLRDSVMRVSCGVGMSLLPVRWLAEPEILEYELVAEDRAGAQEDGVAEPMRA